MRTNLFFYETTDHCSSSSSSLRYNKLIMIMSCIIVLFLMNILADISAIPYFIHETIIFDEPANTTAEQFIFQNNSLYIKPMKFQVEVHGRKFNTVGISSSGVLYMTDKFQQGNSIRSIRLFNLTKENTLLTVFNGDSSFGAFFHNLQYCLPFSQTTITVGAVIERNGTIQYGADLSASKTPQCNVTIEISDGTYNGSADGIGEMMSGKPIHRIVLDSSLLVGYPMIKIIPVPRCLEQTSYNTCISESLDIGKCVWCSEFRKCVYENSTMWNSMIPSYYEIVNASQCVTAESISPVYYVPVIVVVILIAIALIIWFIIRKYKK